MASTLYFLNATSIEATSQESEFKESKAIGDKDFIADNISFAFPSEIISFLMRWQKSS
ncbi:MAG: hypothetical protein ABWU13_13610 [Limnospira maxima]|uniref:hypothetical protein n=1 Tax=Limnospira sp. Paracas R14 TaxID=2981108 RepID=UPI0028E0CF0E|nr:hypothetical protein [Limnospira sp. Paracas R14]